LSTDARKAYGDHRKLTTIENRWAVISLDYAENLLIPPDNPVWSLLFSHTKKN